MDITFSVSGSIEGDLVFSGSLKAPGCSTPVTPPAYVDSGYFGDASDGEAVFDGVAVVSGAYNHSDGTYSLYRDTFFSSMTVDSGITLVTNGFRLYARDVLENNGLIANNGSDAVEGAPGTGASAGNLAGGANGNTGDIQEAIGGSGGNANGSTSFPRAMTPQFGGPFALPLATLGVLVSSTFAQVGRVQYAGAGGSNSTAEPAGGGGGYVVVCARKLVGTGDITADGGDGADFTTPDASGGGGGGGGGGVNVLVYNDKSEWTGVQTANGGEGGLGTPDSVNGGDGHNGRIMTFYSI